MVAKGVSHSATRDFNRPLTTTVKESPAKKPAAGLKRKSGQSRNSPVKICTKTEKPSPAKENQRGGPKAQQQKQNAGTASKKGQTATHGRISHMSTHAVKRNTSMAARGRNSSWSDKNCHRDKRQHHCHFRFFPFGLGGALAAVSPGSSRGLVARSRAFHTLCTAN